MYNSINEYKKGYQPNTYVIKKDYSTIVADTNTMLSRWEQFCSNLLNVNQSTRFEGSEVYSVEPDITESTLLEVELTTNSMAYGTWRFHAAFHKGSPIILSWAEST